MSRYPPKQRLEQARMKSQPPVGMPDKLELKLFEWNDIVSDYSKCLNLCAREEIEFLSSHSQNRKSSTLGTPSTPSEPQI